MIDNSPGSLLFMADGKLAGNATCNRIVGSYSSQGAELKIEPLGTTMMACPEALMNQEQKLLGLLAKVKSYAIDDTGALALTTSDGNTILARR